MEEQKGFLAQLLDFSFTQFITPKVIGVLYGLSVLFAFIFAIASVVGAFSQSAVYGLIVLAISPLCLIIFVFVSRVVSEIVVAMIRIAEDVGYLAGRVHEITKSYDNRE